ncbi:hypothetical protein HNP84_010274 [Thermocatellispora tengchongensis]|uniref:Uncharacterized protein n=1 Tax=Thermocatellispora tengchongensis TaxID=1073253 RepID=A0A840PNR0_9ACTN|nr:hypothetical protein [Thermocatellispora tengchongensis]MBB5140506.1 hypothetical protein [Thermocatellispora tengchongensis]
MPTGILRWEDPAPRTPANDDYAPIATELRNNPGKWAVVAENPDTPEGRRASNRLFNAVKNGYRGFRRIEDGAYRATTRTVDNGDGTKIIRVHAQFVLARR